MELAHGMAIDLYGLLRDLTKNAIKISAFFRNLTLIQATEYASSKGGSVRAR